MNLGRKGEKTRTDIVACAKQLFYAQGYDGTSFSDIVVASGLHRGNIYHYFKNKDDILRAVIERRLEEYSALLGEYDRTLATPQARLQAFVQMIAGHESELVAHGCPIGTLNTELGKNRRDLQKAARALFDLFRNWLAVCFGELGRSADAKALALHLLGRAQGVAVIAHVYGDQKLLKRETDALREWVGSL